MIKSRLLFIIAFSSILYGCKETAERNFVRNDDIVLYKNYSDTAIFMPNSTFDGIDTITDTEFDLSLSYWQERKMQRITDADLFNSFTKLITNVILNCEKKTFGKELYEYIPSFNELYLCGVMKISRQTQSFIFIVKETMDFEIENAIVLCTTYRERLSSVVILSELPKKSYWINGYFSQVKISEDFIENYIPQKVLNIKPTYAPNLETIEYALFIIDDHGFVQFIYI